MQGWHIWLIIAIVLFIAETFTPGFFLACLGVAALGSSLVSYLGMHIDGQIIVFCVTTLIVFLGIRPFFLKYLRSPGPRIETNVYGLIGKTAMVEETIDPRLGKGWVKVGGESWRGISANGTIIPTGTTVRILRVDGTKLFVEPVE